MGETFPLKILIPGNHDLCLDPKAVRYWLANSELVGEHNLWTEYKDWFDTKMEQLLRAKVIFPYSEDFLNDRKGSLPTGVTIQPYSLVYNQHYLNLVYNLDPLVLTQVQ